MKMALKFRPDKWIPVEDALPDEEYDWVLASPVDIKNPKLRYVPCVVELRKGKWASEECKDYESWNHVKITHWMPLPESPR